MKLKPSRPRDAFTLVEMLVVITIITLLASLTVGAAFLAFAKVKQGRIAVELGSLVSAIETYKARYGEYPPDFSDRNLANQHLNRIFRNRSEGLAAVPALDQAEALVFVLHGYSNDSTRPLTGPGGPAAGGRPSELGPQPLLDFDKTRLQNRGNNEYPVYVPQGGLNAPYVYFNADTYAGAGFRPNGARGKAAPYLSDFGGFVQDDKYQIISAGLDGHFGPGRGDDRTFPSGRYKSTERDNITDFSAGTLESKVP